MRKLLMALLPAAVAAQAPAPVSLKPAVATLAEEFSRISSVRELANGRVLIADNLGDPRLVLADLETGFIQRLGRTGPGPREYADPPRRLLALPNDSTLFVSGARPPRWSMMHGAEIVATYPPESRVFLQANDAIGADVLGNVLARRQDPPRTRTISPTRTRYAYVALLANRTTGRIDTVATLAGDMYEQVGGRSFSQVTFSVPEAAMLFPDGWIAVVRLDPYRVDWRSPSGTWSRGAPLPAKPVRFDRREAEWYMKRNQLADPPVARADAIPPLGYQTPLPVPDGSIAIRRMPWSGAPDTDYDFVDRAGKLAATLRLAANERIVGFGKGAVFIAVRDADELERLRKHPWP